LLKDLRKLLTRRDGSQRARRFYLSNTRFGTEITENGNITRSIILENEIKIPYKLNKFRLKRGF